MAHRSSAGGRPPRGRPTTAVLAILLGLLCLASATVPAEGIGPGARVAPPAPHSEGTGGPSAPRTDVPRPAAPVRPGGIDPLERIRPAAIDPTYAGSLTEPAPMGVTDFGVTSSLDPYSYATDRWLGSASFSSLRTAGGGGNLMTFQLNVVLILAAPSGNFTYWIQNVALIDTAHEAIVFENNIWNLSSSTAGLATSELDGNGTVNDQSGLEWYAYGDPTAGEGNGIDLALPATVQVEVTTGVYADEPEVTFLYNDSAAGWVPYDNVSFAHGAAWTDDGFVVDGFQSAPVASYIYTDAEWDFSGEGSGWTDDSSNLTMTLQYWNGHNFQYPRSAWNFGADTEESMRNVVTSLVADNATGVLGDHATNGSTGSLGPLYDPSQVAQVDFEMPTVPNATVRMGSTAIPYRNGAAHVTVPPGHYWSQLYLDGRAVGNGTWVNVSGGASTRVQLPYVVPEVNVTFTETGLPFGSVLGVTLGTFHRVGGSGAVSFTVSPGNYSYRVDPVEGYALAAYNGSLEVGTVSVYVPLAWTEFTFSISFTEDGLAGGTGWRIAVAGGPTAGAIAPHPIELELPNGSYTYSASSAAWYAAEPPNGSLGVSGEPSVTQIDFGPALSEVIGSVSPVTASVTVDGVAVAVSGDGSFEATVAPGRHNVSATAPGYEAASASVETTAGNASAPVILDLAPSGSSSTTGGGSGGPPGGSPLPEGLGIVVVAGAIAVVVVGGVALALRRRRVP